MKKLTTLTAALMLALGLTSVGWQPAGASAVVFDVNVDIKPGSCPNSLNLGSKGVLPVAILGTDDFDVTEVDMATVELVGVSPLRGNIEDVATPIGSPGDPVEDCHDLESDGLLDLSLKFDNRDIVAAIGCVQSGDELLLMLTGSLNDGTPIEGEDIIIVRGNSC